MASIRLTGTSVLALATAALMSTSAYAHRPLPWQRGSHVGPVQAPYKAPKGIGSGTWTALKAGFPGTSFPDTAQVLTDGTVLMHDGCTADWYRLTPDKKGNYVNGTWKKAASMKASASYQPLYFASQVLADGTFIVNGGEYNACNNTHTTLGSYYDPVADSWVNVPPPTGWGTIGDAQSVVLADGTYMLANCCTLDSAVASISGTSVTWTILKSTTTHKADNNNEEGWSTLPDQTILTVDANRDLSSGHNDSEIYSPNSQTWAAGPNTVNPVVDAGSHELGPALLLPNGLVLQVGATGHNDVYDPIAVKWTAAPDFPSLDAADGPAVVLPDGNVLAQVSPGVFQAPSHFYEIKVKTPNRVKMAKVNEPPSAPNQSSYEGRLVMLPTGQAFWTSDVGDIQIYTPQGHAKAAWKPTVTSVPSTLTHGSKNNVVQGTLFNGLSFGGYYGDDAQMATNFPIVRITNTGTGNVCYARTHDHSSMGISDGGPTSTKFDVPSSCATGASTLEVVANGIASAAAAVTVN
jgi:hypothetical protein